MNIIESNLFSSEEKLEILNKLTERLDSSVLDSLDRFINFVKQYRKDNGTSDDKVEYSQGKKWIKVYLKGSHSESVYCFIDPSTGDIYKPASYNAPAKGVRGNINKVDEYINRSKEKDISYSFI